MNDLGTKTVLLGASLLLTATVSLAASRDQRATELKAAKQRIAAKANNQKGYPRAVLDQERVRLGNLIDDLEAGKPVDPQELDRALERANELGR